MTLRDLGFDVNKRVYFNECLSKTMKEVYLKAMSLKKSGILQRAHTYNGHVYVRCSDGAESIKILSIYHLMSITDNAQSSKRRLSNQQSSNRPLHEQQSSNLPLPDPVPTETQASKIQRTNPVPAAAVTISKQICSPLMPGSNTWMSTRSRTNTSSSRPLLPPPTNFHDEPSIKSDLQRPLQTPDQQIVNPFAKSSKTKLDSLRK